MSDGSLPTISSTAALAASMRVRPSGSFAFMLPEASRISAMLLAASAGAATAIDAPHAKHAKNTDLQLMSSSIVSSIQRAAREVEGEHTGCRPWVPSALPQNIMISPQVRLGQTGGLSIPATFEGLDATTEKRVMGVVGTQASRTANGSRRRVVAM